MCPHNLQTVAALRSEMQEVIFQLDSTVISIKQPMFNYLHGTHVLRLNYGT